MAELRWNPILEEWNIVADERQDRPVLPEDSCPLCPGVLEIPEKDFYIVSFENRFPSLRREPEEPTVADDQFYRVKPNKGVCEVLLYTASHEVKPADIDVNRFVDLVYVWSDRFEDLSEEEFVDYIYIFENRGKEIGVTLAHPHGQLYAFPFIPPKAQQTLNSARRHYERSGSCIFCRVVQKERDSGKRVIWEDDNFVAFVPFFARLPYEVHLYPKRHFSDITKLQKGEALSLARGIKSILAKYEGLFDIEEFPYIMAFHQAPVDDGDYPYFHFHLEFYSLRRAEDKIKYRAGVETGMGTFISSLSPEKMARDLMSAKESTSH